MLSYRHAFHAGNHGDVLKHTILARSLAYLIQKDSPFMYLDTHAGAGQYDFSRYMSRKTNEKATGIARIWYENSLPSLLQPYFKVLYKYNSNKELHFYPGSPLIAKYFMRSQDRGVCYELHPTDYTALKNLFTPDQRFQIISQDGFKELLSKLPPKVRRGLILIDPSYEQISEYHSVLLAMETAIKRFPTGIYIIWYPLLNNEYVKPLLRGLDALSIPKTLRVEFMVSNIDLSMGLIGSGVYIINPPWVLAAELTAALPWLADKLGEFAASWEIY